MVDIKINVVYCIVFITSKNVIKRSLLKNSIYAVADMYQKYKRLNLFEPRAYNSYYMPMVRTVHCFFAVNP